jgi:uncharacterized protein (TIGR03118 family)
MRANMPSVRHWALASSLTALCLFAVPASADYIQVNLVSNIPGLAVVTDPQLVNAWGLSSSPTSPWWVSDNGQPDPCPSPCEGVATLYNGNTGAKQGLVVTIPPAATGTPPSAPTGQVFNNTSGFVLPGTAINPNPTKASFIFATEDGAISAWNGAQGTAAVRMADLADASFKGLAIGSAGGADYLYATDFANGVVRVYDTGFALSAVSGNFTDPNLPGGYVPFGIRNLGGNIYVTYAHSSGGGDEDHGAGLGLVDVFDTSGNFIARVASTGGVLDAPWGLALAPSDFGVFGGDLLVGNFGDGTINAYDPLTFAFEGQLLDGEGNPIAIDGLWDLGFGNGVNAGPKNRLFFTSGPDDEANGLFGFITAPEPFTLSVFGAGLAGMAALRRRKKAAIR